MLNRMKEKRQTARHVPVEFHTPEDMEKTSKAIRDRFRTPRKEKNSSCIDLALPWMPGDRETSLPSFQENTALTLDVYTRSMKLVGKMRHFQTGKIPWTSQAPFLKQTTQNKTKQKHLLFTDRLKQKEKLISKHKAIDSRKIQNQFKNKMGAGVGGEEDQNPTMTAM